MSHSVIAYCGKLGAGKSHIVSKKALDLKTEGYSVAILSFADPIKTMMRDVLKIHRDREKQTFTKFHKHDINDAIVALIADSCSKINIRCSIFSISQVVNKFSDEIFSEYMKIGTDEHDVGFRRMMQLIGTEIGRGFYEDLWADFSRMRISRISNHVDVIIFDDVRFVNEASMLVNFCARIYGVIASDEIRSKRRKVNEEISAHQSESEISKIFEFYIDPETSYVYNG